MVLEYDPNFGDLLLSEHEGQLRFQFGDATASTLIEAVKDVKAGGGDYALPSNVRDAPPIWIWWMPRTKQ
jgi:hypothetical protein